MNFKKILISGIAAASIFATTTLPAFAANTKDVLYVNAPWTCANGSSVNNNTAGFVNINLQNDNVNVEFAVKGGQPNQTYHVYITNQNCSTFEQVGTLTTNGEGNGNVHVDVPQIAGATSYDVYAWNAGFTQYLAAPALHP